MKIIGQITEDEVISTFLMAEIESDRFGPRLMSIMKTHHASPSLINNPDLNNNTENKIRRNLLGEFRGFGQNKELFKDFPKEISWFRSQFSFNELTEVQYINWDYWAEVTDGTRSPLVLANKISQHKLVDDEQYSRFTAVAHALESGKHFKEMIFVAKDKHSRIVVLEGHLRLTAYMLSKAPQPVSIDVILGFSDHIDQWDNY